MIRHYAHQRANRLAASGKKRVKRFALKAQPDCPICYGDGRYYEDVCGDGSQMEVICDCVSDPQTSTEKREKLMTNLIPASFKELPFELPISLPGALGWNDGTYGTPQFVAAWWTYMGDELMLSDGRTTFTANGAFHAWESFNAHPLVMPSLIDIDFTDELEVMGEGESNQQALVMDRGEQKLFLAPIKDARKFINGQHPPAPQQVVDLSAEEWDDFVKGVNERMEEITREVSEQDIRAIMQANRRAVENLLKELDVMLVLGEGDNSQ